MRSGMRREFACAGSLSAWRRCSKRKLRPLDRTALAKAPVRRPARASTCATERPAKRNVRRPVGVERAAAKRIAERGNWGRSIGRAAEAMGPSRRAGSLTRPRRPASSLPMSSTPPHSENLSFGSQGGARQTGLPSESLNEDVQSIFSALIWNALSLPENNHSM